MHARKQLLAAGSTVTLVAGGLFFGAAPASAVHNSQECLTAQSQFTAALHTVELNGALEVELAFALQNLVNAQAALDLLDVEGALTIEQINVQIAAALLPVEEQLPNINAIINAEGSVNSAVGKAQAQLDAALAGSALDAQALLDLGIDLEDFLLDAEIDVAALTEDLNAAVAAGVLTQAEADSILVDVNDDGVLTQPSIDLLAEATIEVTLLEAEVDREALAAELQLIIDDLDLALADINTAVGLVAALESGDLAAIVAAEAQIEALLGIDLDLSALLSLQDQLLAAEAILQAEADLDAAIAAVNGLRVQLDALDIDLLELEALFDAAIDTCTAGGAFGGGVGDGADDDGDDDDNGAGGVGGGGTTGGAVTTGGGAGGTGGTNRGMNVQTAVPTASTDPAGIGALAAGIGFMVVAGTMAARRVRNS